MTDCLFFDQLKSDYKRRDLPSMSLENTMQCFDVPIMICELHCNIIRKATTMERYISHYD